MPRGTSAVDYRAHNPKDGGSIPSPATKHGVFMIATKIILTDSTNNFEDLISAVLFFLGNGDSYQLMSHAVESVVTNSWIENKQTFELIGSKEINIINFSENAEKSQLFANSLTWMDSWLPPTATRTIEQYSVEAIPSTATPILVDGDFYLNDNTIDM